MKLPSTMYFTRRAHALHGAWAADFKASLVTPWRWGYGKFWQCSNSVLGALFVLYRL